MDITSEANLRDIERHCNNYFNPQNDPRSKKRKYPKEFLDLVERIRLWRTESPPTGFESEMVVGLHQWAAATTPAGTPVGWQQVFAGELAIWKRAKFI
jgi:hypothetical protein